MGNYEDDFREIAHSGGQFVVAVTTAQRGERQVAFEYRNNRPGPASVFQIQVLPQGIPVADVDIFSPPTGAASTTLPVFIASDAHGLFGHQCPACGQYWRSSVAPAKWRMTCSYCGTRYPTFAFRTPGQNKFVHAWCDMIFKAVNSERDGEHVIDIDEIADLTRDPDERPALYYSEVSQQNNFACEACGTKTDILGRFGYCCSCGTYNGHNELKLSLRKIEERTLPSGSFESYVKDAVAEFDTYARQMVKQLANRIPMTRARKQFWSQKTFYNLHLRVEELKTVFDIDLFRGITSDEQQFIEKMFHRRHVYEHKGGEVDQKYIEESGDTSVKQKQTIRESKESSYRTAKVIEQLSSNFLDGFHAIFPVEETPIRFHERR
jgi:hypothetical protein